MSYNRDAPNWRPIGAAWVAVAMCLSATVIPCEASEIISAQSAIVGVIDEVEIPARAAGVLATMRVREGDVVDSGAILASIDDREAQLLFERAAHEYASARKKASNDIEIRSTEKALEFAQGEYQRLQRASDSRAGSVSRSELEEAKVAAVQARLDLEQAQHDQQVNAIAEQLKLKDRDIARHKILLCRIEAPIRGTVVEVLRQQGEWVEPGEPVVRVVRTDRLQVDGLVDGGLAADRLLGASVVVSIDRADEPPITEKGSIVFLNPEVNPVSGQLRVRAEFDNKSGKFLPGMRVLMEISPRKSALANAPANRTRQSQ